MQHRDVIGQLLQAGNYVAFASSNQLTFGTVIRLTPKMVKVKSINGWQELNKYPSDCIRVNNDASVTMYLLKQSAAK